MLLEEDACCWGWPEEWIAQAQRSLPAAGRRGPAWGCGSSGLVATGAGTSGPHPTARPSGRLKERPHMVLPEVIYCWYQCKELHFIRALAKNVKHRERCCCHSPAADRERHAGRCKKIVKEQCCALLPFNRWLFVLSSMTLCV